MSRNVRKRFWSSFLWSFTLVAMILNLLSPSFDALSRALAQEVTPETTPTDIPAPTEEPTTEPTVEATLEATPTETIVTPVPTDVATEAVTPVETATETPVLPTVVPPTAEVSLFVDNFQDAGASLTTNGWSNSGGWTIGNEPASDGSINFFLSAAPTGISETAALPQIQWSDLTLSARVRVSGIDSAGITVRAGVESYTVVINGYGFVQLYRGTLLVAEGPAVATPEPVLPESEATAEPIPAVWRTVNIQAENDTLTVLLDGVAQITYTDPTPIGAGAVAFSTNALNTGNVDFDDILINRLQPMVPPTVEATAEVTVEATEEAALTPGVLLSDDFEGDLSAWTSTSTEIGIVEAGENNHALLMPAGALLTPANTLVLGDFRLDARFALVTSENGGLQITLRDGYSLVIDTTHTSLVRGETEIATSQTAHEAGAWLTLSVTMERDHITVTLNDTVEIDGTDAEPTLAGGIGFSALGTVMLDDVVVTDLTSQEVLAEVTASPTPLAIDEVAQSKMDGALLTVLNVFLGGDDATFRAEADTFNIFIDDAGRIRVRLYAANNAHGETLRTLIEGTGGLIERVVDSEVIALVPPMGVIALASTPEVAGVILPDAPASTDSSNSVAESVSEAVGSIVPQSLDIVGSNDWNTAGVNGANVDIAVIDSVGGGFVGASAGLGAGGGNQQCLYNNPGGASSHGTSVVDVICDIAPNARVFGFLISDAATLKTTIDNIRLQSNVAGITNNTYDIILITVDLGANVSAGDGTGTGMSAGNNFYQAIADARAAGIVVIASAGNSGNGAIGSRYVSFSLANGASANITTTATVGSRINISWSAWSTTGDINASLTGPGAKGTRATHGNIPGYSFTVTSANPTLTLNNNLGAGALSVQVQIIGGGAITGGVTPSTNAGTLARPADSPNVIAVGAVCASQADRYPRLSDSSVGPAFDAGGVIPAAITTVGSAIKPDVVAPSHVSATGSTTAAGCNVPASTIPNPNPPNIASPTTGFNGTSAAAAHVAGMAALLRSNTINNSMNTRVGPGLVNAPAEIERYIQTHTVDIFDTLVQPDGNPPIGTPNGWDRTYGAGLTMLGSPTFDMSTVQNFGNASTHDANTFYVGQANLDSTQVGDSTNPYLSIAEAIQDHPGQRIVVMSGEYVSGINIGVAGTSLVSYDAADIVNRPDTYIWVNDSYATFDLLLGESVGGINVNNIDNITVNGFTFNSAHPLYLEGPAPLFTRPRAVGVNAVAGFKLQNNIFNGFTSPVSILMDGATEVSGNTFNGFALPQGSYNSSVVLAVSGNLGSGGNDVVNVVNNLFSNNSVIASTTDDNLPRQAIVYLHFGQFNFYGNRMYGNTAEAMVSINQWEDVGDPFNGTISNLEARIFSSSFTNNTIINSDARSIVNLYQGSQFRFVNNTVAATNLSEGLRSSFITLGGTTSPAAHFNGTTGAIHEWEIHNNVFYNNLLAGGLNGRNLIDFSNSAVSLGCFNLAGTADQGAHNNWFIYQDLNDTNTNRPDQGECQGAVSGGANGNIFEEYTTLPALQAFEATNFFGAATDPVDPYRLRPTSTVGVDGASDVYVVGIFDNPLTVPVDAQPDALRLTRTVNRIAGLNDTDLGAYELSDPQPLVVSGTQTVNGAEDSPFIAFQLGQGVVSGGILPLRFSISSQPANFNASATSPCSGVPVQYDAASNQAAYCPPPDFYNSPGYPNTVTFNYIVTDALGEASATGTVNVNVTAVADGDDGGLFGTVANPQTIFTDVLTPTDYRLRPYFDFNNFRLSDPTTERGQDYAFTFSNAQYVSGSTTLFGSNQTATMAAINAALTAAGSNGGYFRVSPIPGNTGEIVFTYSVTDSTSQTFANAGRVRLIVTERLAGIGLHDDVSLDFVFSPSWVPLYFETANNNSMHFTSTLDEYVDFYFTGDTFIINMLALTSGANIEVTIDPDGDGGAGFQAPGALTGLTCTPNINMGTGVFSTVSSVTTIFSSGCRGLDTNYSGTIHILRIKNKSAGLYAMIDSIEIRGASLAGGYYEERDFSLTYSGVWSDYIALGPKGGSSRYTTTLGSTISFQYDAGGSNAIVIYHSVSPAYGTLRVCASSGGCVNVNQNGPLLKWGQREWIDDGELGIGGSSGVHTITMTPIFSGVPVSLEALYIHSQPTNALGAPLSASPTIIEDNNAALYYIGTWSFFGAAQAVGGSAQSTVDPSASVMFNIDSTANGIGVYRTSGAGVSAMEICIDGECRSFIAAGSTIYGDTVVFRVGTPGPHVVEIRNTSSGFLNIEAIRILGAAGPLGIGFYEETEAATDFNLSFSGTWTNLVLPNFVGGSARYTASSASAITFSIDANVVKRIGIYRTIYPGGSNFSVCASGGTCAIVVNNTAIAANQRLAILTLDDLGITDTLIHTITIQTVTNGALGIIEAIELRGIQGTLLPGYYEERQVGSNLNLLMTGTWSDGVAVGPRGGSQRYASTTTSEFSFQYDPTVSNGIVVYHPIVSGFGTLNVCNGGTCVPINQNGAATSWGNRKWITNADLGSPVGVVTITLRPSANGPSVGVEAIYIHGTSNGFGTLSTNATPYEETNAAFGYVGTWTNMTNASMMGGASKVTTDPSGTIYFNIDAAARGVAVYRTAGTGWSPVEICIDAVCQTFGARSSVTIYSDSVSSRTTIAGPHVVEIRNVGATYLSIEAVQVLGATTPLGIGLYEDREITSNFNMTYTGNWNFFNIPGMVGSDAHYTSSTVPTLTFQINADVVKRIVVFRTMGPAGWSATRVCGVACINVNNTGPTAYGAAQVITLGELNLPLTGTQTVTINAATNAFMAIEAVQLVGAAGALPPGYYEATESGANYNMTFNGTWTNFASATGLRGGLERYATSTSSNVTFTYDTATSNGIMVYFTKSTGRGSLHVCNGATCVDIDQNSATTQWGQRHWITEDDLNIEAGGPFTITMSPTTNGMIAGIDAVYIHGNNSIGAPLTINGTPYQENNPSFRYINAWTFFNFSGFNGGNAAITTDPGGAVMFNIESGAAGIALFRTLASTLGPTEICIDDTCQTFLNSTSTVLGDTSALLRAGIPGNQHVVEIRNIGAQTNVEAVQVISAVSALNVGYYEETEAATAFNLSYTGPWISWVNSALLGGTSRLVSTAGATASFKVNGANFDRIAIFHSVASGWGSFNVCNGANCVTVNTSAATTRYGVAAIITRAQLGNPAGEVTITITTQNALPVSIEAIQILGLPGNLGLGFYEETEISTSFNLTYAGAWSDFITPVMMGGSARYTTSNTATATFSIDTAQVKRIAIFSTSGPGWSDTQVCNGPTCVTFSNNSATTIYGVPHLINTNALGAGQMTVTIRSVTNGALMDIEALQLLGDPAPLAPGYYEETEASTSFGLTYTGWAANNGVGPRGGSMRYSNNPAHTITFQYNATTSEGIVIYHPAFAGWGVLQVCNGVSCHNINQNSAGGWNQRTWVTESQIGDPVGTVTITIRPQSTSYVGIEAIYIHGPNSIGAELAVSATPYEENNPALRYVGTWTPVSGSVYFGGSARQTSDPGGSILFNVAGPAFGVAVYRTSTTGWGTMRICIDASCQTFPPSSALTYSEVVFFRGGAGPHVVEITNGGTALPMNVEAIRVLAEQDTMTPGLYQETDPNLIYTGTWTSIASTAFNGGTARSTTTPNDTLSFRIGGGTTGFILFGTRVAGGANMQVCYTPQLPTPGTQVCTIEQTSNAATQFTFGFATYGLNNKQLSPNQANDQEYVVTVKHMGTAGQNMFIEAIAVLGTTTTTLTAGMYDDQNPGIVYAPNSMWLSGSAAGYLNSTYHFAGYAGMLVQIRFTGSSITVFQLAAPGLASNVNACLIVPVTTGNQVECANFSQSAGASTFATPITVYGFGFGTHEIVLENQTATYFSVDTIQIR